MSPVYIFHGSVKPRPHDDPSNIRSNMEIGEHNTALAAGVIRSDITVSKSADALLGSKSTGVEAFKT